MIKLVAANYCQECPNFNPTCERVLNESGRYDHYVSCVNSEECRHLCRYLELQLKVKEEHKRAVDALMKEACKPMKNEKENRNESISE